jgi:hypothetical protein
VFLLEVTDGWFNRSTMFHPAPETFWRTASTLFVGMDFNITFIVMPEIPAINKEMFRWLHKICYLIKSSREGMPIAKGHLPGRNARTNNGRLSPVKWTRLQP